VAMRSATVAPKSTRKRADDVTALKQWGMGIRAISLELGMAVSSVHTVLASKKAKRQPAQRQAGPRRI